MPAIATPRLPAPAGTARGAFAGLAGALGRTLRGLRAARDLAELTDRELLDIGLTRHDVSQLARGIQAVR